MVLLAELVPFDQEQVFVITTLFVPAETGPLIVIDLVDSEIPVADTEPFTVYCCELVRLFRNRIYNVTVME